MKRIILFVVILSYSILCIFSAEPPKSASISFTAGVIANFGFTTSTVSPNNYIKPAEISSGTVYKFGITDGSYNRLSAPAFNFYYQIFCRNPVCIEANVTPLISNSNPAFSIPWSDASGTFSEVINQEMNIELYTEVGESDSPRAGSKRIEPIITDIDDINWDDTYATTIELRLIVK